MTTPGIALGVIVVLLVFGAPVHGDSMEGGYLSVAGSIFQPRDPKVTVGNLKGEFDLGTGRGGAAAMGYAFGNGVRLEVEVGMQNIPVEAIVIGPFEYVIQGTGMRGTSPGFTAPTKGDIRTVLVMGNVLYVHEQGSLPVLPYIGAGLGWVRHTVGNVAIPSRGLSTPEASDSTAGYQAMAGIKIPVNRLEINVGYRFFGTSTARFRGIRAKPRAHLVEVGLTVPFS